MAKKVKIGPVGNVRGPKGKFGYMMVYYIFYLGKGIDKLCVF